MSAGVSRLKVKDVCVAMVFMGAMFSTLSSRTEAQRQVSLRNQELEASASANRELEARLEARRLDEATAATGALAAEKASSGAVIKELGDKATKALDALRDSREAGARLGAELDAVQAQLDSAREERDALGRELVLAEAELLRERCLLYTSPSPRDGLLARMPSSA